MLDLVFELVRSHCGPALLSFRHGALALAISFILLAGARAADVTFNIQLIAESDPLAGAQVYGDVWAEGGYAYVGTDVNGGGMHIFDVQDSSLPSYPTFLKRYAGDQLEDVEVWNGWGFFGSDRSTATGTGVDIVDLADPTNPVFTARVNAAIGGHNKVHTLSVYDGYMYTTDNATDVIKITRIFDPNNLEVVNPLVVKSLDLDLGPTGQTNIASHEVIVRNDRMYVASKDNNFNNDHGWVSIYNVSDPAVPTLVKQFKSGARTHSALPSDDGKLLIVTEERPDGNVFIYNMEANDWLTNANPTPLATLNKSMYGIEALSPHHPHLHGNLLFITWYEAGLQVFNISDPANPVHVGAFDTCLATDSGPCFGTGTSTNYNGNWGVDLSLGLNKVMLSDRQRGLIIVDASGVVQPGDYNQDMVVDHLDYLVWRSSYGTSSSGLHRSAFADGNYDGIVDAADYVIWRDNFGKTGPAAGSGGSQRNTPLATVPEPSAIAMAAAGLALALLRVRRHG